MTMLVARTSEYGQYSATKAPGVYVQDAFGEPHQAVFATGVPVFLGTMEHARRAVGKGEEPKLQMLSLWSQFGTYVGPQYKGCMLASAVKGFFANGGHWCYVVVLRDRSMESLDAGLLAISRVNTLDLVCAPDLGGKDFIEQQQRVVDHCDEMGDRFAILDSRPEMPRDGAWEQWSCLGGRNAALYYPWVKVHGFNGELETVPPCGHVAGVYSRSDRGTGVHKAPANEALEGVVDLDRRLTSRDQDWLNPKGINCLRSFPGRGIRVWGARTLSGQPDWMYVNVRRLFLTAARWIDWNLLEMSFEPNDARLWSRIERKLGEYFTEQYRLGALKGTRVEDAFYVKCDGETNPAETRALGQVVTEIGLAPATPFEFVVVRLIRGARGAV